MGGLDGNLERAEVIVQAGDGDIVDNIPDVEGNETIEECPEREEVLGERLFGVEGEISEDCGENFRDISFHGNFEFDGALKGAEKDAHPKFIGPIKAAPDEAVI